MTQYYYSPTVVAFYPASLMQAYIDAGTWPDDAKEIDESYFVEFTQNPPEGKVRGDVDGMPSWVDAPPPPPPTHEELVNQANQDKKILLESADSVFLEWQTKLLLNIASEDEKNAVIAWVNYKQAVRAVDTNEAPNITWPEQPPIPDSSQ